VSPATSLAPERPTLGAPIESLLSRPSAALLPRPGEHLGDLLVEPEMRVLRPPVRAFKGHEVVDPAQARERQIRMDEEASAIDQARSLAQRNSDSKIAWARLAQTLAGAGEYAEAVEAARRVLQLSSDLPELEMESFNATSEFVASRVLLSAGLSDEAEIFLREHSQMAGPWMLLYAAIAEGRGDHSQALARLEGGIGAEFSGFRGYLMLRLGRWQNAIVELRAAGGESSRNPDLLTNLGYAYALAGSQRKAIRCARQASILSPWSQRLSFNLVSLLVGSARWDEAKTELKRLQAEFPDDLKVASVLGFVHLNAGNVRETVREYRRALNTNRFKRTSAEYSELAVSLALIEWVIGKRTRAEVLAEVRKRIRESKPTQAMALVLADVAPREIAASEVRDLYIELRKRESEEALLPLAVKLAFLERDYDGGLTLAKRWVEEAPLNPDAAQHLMTLYGHLFGEFGEAIEVGAKALIRIPGSDGLRNAVGFYLALCGDYSGAHKVLEGVADPNLPTVLATRGLVKLGEGQIDEGLDLYDRAIEVAGERTGRGQILEEFRTMARLYEWLALCRLGLTDQPEIRDRFDVALPDDWGESSQLLALSELARQIDVSWPECSPK